jgi:vancomycin resistance protein YoaR
MQFKSKVGHGERSAAASNHRSSALATWFDGAHHVPFVLLVVFSLSVSVMAWLYVHRPFSSRLSAYVTDLAPRTAEQAANIKKAASSISGFILKSGEILSLNDQAGPFSEARGFRPERAFREKGVVREAGGGVCQLASTLYNAARNAGLEVVERVPHSQKVESVPPGYDATLAYGVADLKIKNPYPFPVKILSKISQGQLMIEIWGKESRHDVERL